MESESALEKGLIAEIEFWKEKFYEQVKLTTDLQLKVDRYADALKEYRAAAEFLSASGDNPLDYDIGVPV